MDFSLHREARIAEAVSGLTLPPETTETTVPPWTLRLSTAPTAAAAAAPPPASRASKEPKRLTNLLLGNEDDVDVECAAESDRGLRGKRRRQPVGDRVRVTARHTRGESERQRVGVLGLDGDGYRRARRARRTRRFPRPARRRRTKTTVVDAGRHA